MEQRPDVNTLSADGRMRRRIGATIFWGIIASASLEACGPAVTTTPRTPVRQAKTAVSNNSGDVLPNQTLITASNRSGTYYHLYEKQLRNGTTKQLTTGSYNNMNPAASPDSTFLTFYSDRANGLNQIYLVERAHPDNITRLTNDGASDYDPVFMPDGRRILYKSNHADGYGDIFIMNVDGSDQRNLTPSLSHTEEWKPTPLDNTHVVITSRKIQGDSNSDELLTLNIETGEIGQLTNNHIPDWYPAAQPNSSVIAFVSTDKPGGRDSIYLMDIKQPNTRTKLNFGLSGDSDDPSWTPDGRIAFSNNELGHYAVYLSNRDGTGLVTLDTAPAGDDLSPLLIAN